jgi:hypothetical protein
LDQPWRGDCWLYLELDDRFHESCPNRGIHLDSRTLITEAKGTGWYSFDKNGVHFVGLVNVANLKAGGLGALGAEQLAWLADD